MNASELIHQRSGLSDRMSALSADIDAIAQQMIQCLQNGGTIFACGNGGSASQAAHFAAELVGRFKLDRKALPAYSLSDNISTVTAIANDYGYENVFSRQVDGLLKPGDCLLALSTSGNSANVVNACASAKACDGRVFVLCGESGGEASSFADVALNIPDTDTARIQEMHLMVIHIICELVEAAIFPRDGS